MLLLWIICVISVLFCYAFMLVCLLMPCGHLLGKGWPLGSRLWCLIVSLSLSPFVSWVRCGAWLYRFLIFALFLTLNIFCRICNDLKLKLNDALKLEKNRMLVRQTPGECVLLKFIQFREINQIAEKLSLNTLNSHLKFEGNPNVCILLC